jgi:MFS family permease
VRRAAEKNARVPAARSDAADSDARLRLIVALGVTQIVSWGSIYYLFALLLEPLQQSLGAGRSEVVGAFSVGLLASGLGAPVVGRIIDRHGGRAVMTIGSVAAAVLLAVLAHVQSLALLYVTWFGLGCVMAATLYEPAFAVVTQAFGAGYRRAITLLTLFGGFASTVFWPLTTALIEWLGWRDAVLVLAAIHLLVCVPLHAWLVPAAPRRAAHAAGATAAAGATHEGWLRSPAFYGLALAYVGHALVISGMAVHLIVLLGERGLGAATVAWIGALIGPMQVAGRVAELAVSGRASAIQVGRVAVLLLPAALLVLWLAGTHIAALVLFAVLYGAGNGTMTVVRGTVPVEIFGRERYGTITGVLAAPSLIARAAGPTVVALVWAASGGYDQTLLWLAGVGALGAAVFIVGVRRPDDAAS